MFEEFLGKIAKFVARRPGIVVSIVLLFIVFSIISASNLRFAPMKYENYLPSNDKVLIQYDLYKKDFGVSENSVFIFLRGDDILNTQVYEYMLRLEKNLNQIDGVTDVISPASIVVKIYGKLPQNEGVLKELSERFASNLIISPSWAVMVVHLREMNQDKLNEVSNQIEKTLVFTPKPIGVKVEVTGNPVLDVQIIKSVQKNLRLTANFAIILMILILFTMFSGVVRRKRMALMPLVISIMSVIAVVGFMPRLGIRMNAHLSSMIPILIGLAIEYAAQVQSRFEEERLEGRSKDDAVVVSITKTGLAVLMAMLTTVIGFMSMIASNIPTLAWFGMLMSLGLVVAYILSMTFLPAILKVTDKDEIEVVRRIYVGYVERILIAVSRITTSNPKKILALALILIIFGAYASTQVKLETDRMKYFPQNLPAIVRFKELERAVGGQNTFVVVLSCDELNAKTLKKADDLAKYIVEREDLVYGYDSLSSLIEKIVGRLPESDTELSLMASKIPKKEIDRFYSEGLLAIYFKTNADTHDKKLKLWNSLKKDVQFFGWHEGHYVTGQTVVMTEMGVEMVKSQFTMTIVAYVLIVVLLFAVYRSIIRAVTPLLAITTVIGVLNIYMATFGIKQTMFSIAMNSITLGLGIDFSIHVTERYFEERRNVPPIDAVRRTIGRTGKAIVTSALTMAGGFGALSLSNIPAIHDFGILALISIIFSLVSALTVVPAFLMIAEKFRGFESTLSGEVKST
ncbi:hydrophobe/amphiphile efflux-3 (HAE3) family transporter [Archaeoglobus sp.]